MDEVVEVELTITGGPPWGFRLQGGSGRKLPLIVNKVRRKSKCDGYLRESDIIVSINGESVDGKSYDDVMNIVDNCGDQIKIVVQRLASKDKPVPSEIAMKEEPMRKRSRTSLKENEQPSSETTTTTVEKVSKKSMSRTSTAEFCETKFKTPDGFKIRETKSFRYGKGLQPDDFDESVGKVNAFASVTKLPQDVIKRSSWSRSPISKSPDISRETTEKTTTTRTETKSSSKLTPEAVPTSPIFSQVRQTGPKQQLRMSTTSTTRTREVVDGEVVRDDEVTSKETSTAPKKDLIDVQPVQVEWKRPTEDLGPGTVKVTTKTTSSVQEHVDDTMTKNENFSTEETKTVPIEAAKPRLEFPKPEDFYVERKKTEEEIREAKTKSGSTAEVPYYLRAGMSEVSNMTTQEGGVPPQKLKQENVPRGTTVEEPSQPGGYAAPPAPAKTTWETASRSEIVDDSISRMPALVYQQQTTSSPLFQVSKFTTTETRTNYSWSPTRGAQQTTTHSVTSSSAPGQQYGAIQDNANNRYSSVFEQSTTKAPPPPPPKPPRPVSAPNLENRILSFSDQIKREICTDERRTHAEVGCAGGDERDKTDRRSASLEMIKRALVPPSEEELKDTLITTTKKKMFSSSSFYEEPNAIYPTVEEQFDLAQKIANSLSAETNKKSKGANMFIKRVNKSSKWVHESPTREETTITEFHTSTTTNGNKSQSPDIHIIQNGSPYGRSKLKPVLNPIKPQDSQMFAGTDREFKAQGMALSPAICANLVQDLNTSKGKGATIFAKRRKKSEKWVVDDSKVQSKNIEGLPSGPILDKNPKVPKNRLSAMIDDGNWLQQKIKYVKSPWEAALESPIGSCDAAFEVVTSRRAPEMPPVPAQVIKARLPDMLNLNNQDSTEGSAAGFMRRDPGVFKPKTPRGWTRSLHDPSSSDLMGGSISDTETLFHKPQIAQPSSTIQPPSKFSTNYNTLPRSWGSSRQGNSSHSSSYRPVSLYSDL